MRDILARGVTWARGADALGPDFGIGYSICGYGENADADEAIRQIARDLAGTRLTHWSMTWKPPGQRGSR